MNEWEKALQKIVIGNPKVPHRYEIRPGETGPAIYCSTCSAVFVKEGTVFLDELIEESMEHEKNTHPKSS